MEHQVTVNIPRGGWCGKHRTTGNNKYETLIKTCQFFIDDYMAIRTYCALFNADVNHRSDNKSGAYGYRKCEECRKLTKE